MTKSRFRFAARRDPRSEAVRAASFEGMSVLVAFALFWVVSCVRVVGALVRHEVFGAESTLALMAVVAVPLVLRGGIRARRAANSQDDAAPLA